MQSTAIITGGTGGLGAAVTERFLSDGWRVLLPVEPGRRGTVPDHAAAEALDADLMDPVQAGEVAAAAGPDLRAVVNLVGGFDAPGRVHETPIEAFEAQLRLNLRPTYLMTAAGLPALRAAGSGAIVCVSSRAAVQPFAGAAGYVTAKAAVLAFVDALHEEYRDEGIRANAVLPSVIDTPANRQAMPSADHERWVAPAQIADVIAFLCSDAGTPTGGAHVPVYGRA